MTWGRGVRAARRMGLLAAAVAMIVSAAPGAARADDAAMVVDAEIPARWLEFIEANHSSPPSPIVVSRIDTGWMPGEKWWIPVAGGPVPAVRFGGRNRGETARLIAVNQTGYAAAFGGEDETAVIVARGDQYPDALAASYLAGHAAAPVALTSGDAVSSNLRRTLEHWGGPGGVDVVYILGGTSAISQGVQDELESDGYTVKRLSGTNRSGTAAAIAGEFGMQGVGVDGMGRRTAIVASGASYADALVAGPLAAARRFPLLLAGADTLPDATAAALGDLGIQRVLLAGGTAAVSAAVESQIAAIVGTVDRVSGGSRFDTAVEFARLTVDEFGFDTRHVGLASGANFPDALGLAPHAGLGMEGPFPVVLGGAGLPTATREYFEEIADCEFRAVHIAGGTAAISDAQKDDARDALTVDSDDCGVVVLRVRTGSPTTEDDNGHGKARLVFTAAGELCYEIIAWTTEEPLIEQADMVTGQAAWVWNRDEEEIVTLNPPERGWVYDCVDVNDATRDSILDDPNQYIVSVHDVNW